MREEEKRIEFSFSLHRVILLDLFRTYTQGFSFLFFYQMIIDAGNNWARHHANVTFTTRRTREVPLPRLEHLCRATLYPIPRARAHIEYNGVS